MMVGASRSDPPPRTPAISSLRIGSGLPVVNLSLGTQFLLSRMYRWSKCSFVRVID